MDKIWSLKTFKRFGYTALDWEPIGSTSRPIGLYSSSVHLLFVSHALIQDFIPYTLEYILKTGSNGGCEWVLKGHHDDCSDNAMSTSLLARKVLYICLKTVWGRHPSSNCEYSSLVFNFCMHVCSFRNSLPLIRKQKRAKRSCHSNRSAGIWTVRFWRQFDPDFLFFCFNCYMFCIEDNATFGLGR